MALLSGGHETANSRSKVSPCVNPSNSSCNHVSHCPGSSSAPVLKRLRGLKSILNIVIISAVVLMFCLHDAYCWVHLWLITKLQHLVRESSIGLLYKMPRREEVLIVALISPNFCPRATKELNLAMPHLHYALDIVGIKNWKPLTVNTICCMIISGKYAGYEHLHIKCSSYMDGWIVHFALCI